MDEILVVEKWIKKSRNKKEKEYCTGEKFSDFGQKSTLDNKIELTLHIDCKGNF